MRMMRTLVVFITFCFSVFYLNSATAAGERHLDLDEYHGKVVVVDFWASWCVPCRRSFPWLDAMQRKYGADGLVVIGVNEDAQADAASEFLDEVPVTFTILRDPDGVLAERFELLAMPSTFVIGRDGRQVAQHLGFRSARTDEYEHLLRRTLGLPPAPAESAAGNTE